MVYKRGNVYWYRIRWTVKRDDGSKEHFEIRRPARAPSRRKAKEVEEEHRRALRLGQVHPLDPWPKPPAPQSPLLREFADRFMKHAELHTKPRTARFYEDCLRRVRAFTPLAEKALAAITGELVSKYVNWRKAHASGNSSASLNGEIRTLRRLFHLAEEWGVIDKAPTIHELPVQTTRNRVPSFEEEARYLKESSLTLRGLAILAADTGLRPNSELFPLERKDVHLARSGNPQHGYIHVASGKTSNAVRNVPLTPRAASVLEMLLSLPNKSPFVWPGSGRSGHITTLQHAHERAMQKAGLEPFPFYCWRHTFGTRCAESGMDKFSLARLMGHSSPRVAERYYIHVTEPHVTAGFERFLDYQASHMIDAFPAATEKVQ